MPVYKISLRLADKTLVSKLKFIIVEFHLLFLLWKMYVPVQGFYKDNWLHSIPGVVESWDVSGLKSTTLNNLASEQPVISCLLFDLTSITEPIR